MKLIITDADIEGVPLGEECRVIRADGGLRHCIGCFGCWVRTPGTCVIRDGREGLGAALAACTELVLVSRCYYGSVSPSVKAAQDRALSYIHPYFEIRDGMMHHKRRYNNRFLLSAHLYAEGLTDAEKETARSILAANAKNYDCELGDVFFYETADELIEKAQRSGGELL